MIGIDLNRAVELIESGEVIGFPTETFYGIGCSALSAEGLEKLKKYKPRSSEKGAYPVIIGELSQLKVLAAEVSREAEKLIDKYWPGPLTLVFPAKGEVHRALIGPSGGVAIRWSSHELAAELSRRAGVPIVATSANPPGLPPPDSAESVAEYFPELPILDGGPTPGERASTIVDLTVEPPEILREGPIPSRELLSLLLSEGEYTRDGMFRERVIIYQKKKGYRFSLDAVLLADFAARFSPRNFLDVGTGSGVIGLALLYLWEKKYRDLEGVTGIGIEVQGSLARLAKLNVIANRREGTFFIENCDIRQWNGGGKRWPLIILNPPYRDKRGGPQSPDSERAGARTQLYGNLTEILRASGKLLNRRGRILVIYPAKKLPELLESARKSSLWPVRYRFVYPNSKSPANLILVELSRNFYREVEILPPSIIYKSSQPNSEYTEEIERLFNGYAEV